MRSKIFSLATLSFSDFIGKWQKKKKKRIKFTSKIHLKNLIFSYEYSEGRAVNSFAVQCNKCTMPETYSTE